MKRTITFLAAFLLASGVAFGRAKLQGHCELGAGTVTVAGYVSSAATKVQRSYPSCTVTVFLAGIKTLATIYADNAPGSLPMANPFTAASNGSWFFYGDNGRYDVQMSGGGIPLTFTRGDFGLFDPVEMTVYDVKSNACRAKGDGVTDDQVAIARCVALIPATGGILYFPAGTYVTTSANPLVLVTSKSAVTVMGAGIDLTLLKQKGTGDGIVFTDPTEIMNPRVTQLTVNGSSVGNRGIAFHQSKDGWIEQVNVNGFRSHAVDVTGAFTMHFTLRNGRIGSGNPALASGRGLNARAGNGISVQKIYFDIMGNPATGGVGYDTGVDVRGASGVVLIDNMYNGVTYAVQTASPTVAIGEHINYTSPAPSACSYGFWPQANNQLTIIGSTFDDLAKIVYNPGGISERYITLIGVNAAGRNVIAGTVAGDVITPTQIVANQNDYLPNDATGVPIRSGRYAVVWRLSTNAERDITGIGGAVLGKYLTLINIGSYPIRLIYGSGLSLPTNRISTSTGQNVYILSGESATLVYEDVSWRVLTPLAPLTVQGRVITPPMMTADQDNYLPNDATYPLQEGRFAAVWRISGSAVRTITGIGGGVVGKYLTLINIGTFPIRLMHYNAGSAVLNRIDTAPSGGDIWLLVRETITLVYEDNSVHYWRVLTPNVYEPSPASTISPPQITADQNDYSPANCRYTHFWRLNTDAARTVTGIDIMGLIGDTLAPTARSGYQLTVVNAGAFNLLFAHEGGGSAAENRILIAGGAPVTLIANAVAIFTYDGVSRRWRYK